MVNAPWFINQYGEKVQMDREYFKSITIEKVLLWLDSVNRPRTIDNILVSMHKFHGTEYSDEEILAYLDSR